MKITLALLPAVASAATLLKSDDVADDTFVIKMKESVSKSGVKALSERFYTKKVFDIGANFQGFTARLNAEELTDVLTNEQVEMVSPNVRVYTSGILNKKITFPNVTRTASTSMSCPDSQSDHSWGQARVTSSNLGTFAHDASWGSGVDIYVTDTGTLCAHDDFAGKTCTCGPDYSAIIGPGVDGCADGNGHGTFCSSIAAGNVYGVAKQANLIGVKVMGNLGAGTLCGIIDGFEYVANAAAATGRPSVASVSLGTQGTCDMVDAAANALVDSGVQTAIAAGNSGTAIPRLANTCTGSSPGAAEKPVTVGSSDKQDDRSYFSNWGPCNDVFAPGSDITGAYSGRNFPTDQYITGSGTSMAAPHVAGLMAALLSIDSSIGADALKAKVIAESEKDSISLACSGLGEEECLKTPNTLLHFEC